MQAIVFNKYGSPDVLQLQEIDKPVVNDDDILVRIHAASANPYDWHFMTGKPYIARISFGLFKPKVSGLGAALAGQVEAVGKNVTHFRPGDEVFGEVDGEVPGKPILELGSFAEYVCVTEGSVVLKPANLTFEQAAVKGAHAVILLRPPADPQTPLGCEVESRMRNRSWRFTATGPPQEAPSGAE